MSPRTMPPLDPDNPDLDVASAVMGNRNKSLIIRHLWQTGSSTGTEIITATGISGPTMSLAMQQLEQWLLVTASIPPQERHGRPVTYTLDRNRIQHLVTVWMDFVTGD